MFRFSHGEDKSYNYDQDGLLLVRFMPQHFWRECGESKAFVNALSSFGARFKSIMLSLHYRPIYGLPILLG